MPESKYIYTDSEQSHQRLTKKKTEELPEKHVCEKHNCLILENCQNFNHL